MHATFVQGIFHEEPNMTLNIVSIFSINLDLLADHLITHFHSLDGMVLSEGDLPYGHTNEVEVGRERVSSLKKPNMFMFC